MVIFRHIISCTCTFSNFSNLFDKFSPHRLDLEEELEGIIIIRTSEDQHTGERCFGFSRFLGWVGLAANASAFVTRRNLRQVRVRFEDICHYSIFEIGRQRLTLQIELVFDEFQDDMN